MGTEQNGQKTPNLITTTTHPINELGFELKKVNEDSEKWALILYLPKLLQSSQLLQNLEKKIKDKIIPTLTIIDKNTKFKKPLNNNNEQKDFSNTLSDLFNLFGKNTKLTQQITTINIFTNKLSHLLEIINQLPTDKLKKVENFFIKIEDINLTQKEKNNNPLKAAISKILSLPSLKYLHINSDSPNFENTISEILNSINLPEGLEIYINNKQNNLNQKNNNE